MRVFVKSFGCSTNLADGELLSGCLAKAGHMLVDSTLTADIVIFNTCAVKGPTENRMFSVLKRVPPGKKLVVAGCLPLINLQRLCKEVRFDGIVGPAAGEKIVEVAERISKGEKVVALKNAEKAKPSLSLPRLQSSHILSIIPISYGCLGSCAYCCVVFARGQLRSYPVKEIVEKAERDLASGVREIWLASQDTACYGRDKGTNLAELLSALGCTKKCFKIRVGMMTPNRASEILEDLIEAFSDEHIFKFVHLPVQSGDDNILRRMRRFYSVKEFHGIVKAFRTRFPEITVSTDVICGFPGEREESFEKTLQLIEVMMPDIVNVSRFFARPNTIAAGMQGDFVPLAEIKRRSSLVARLAKKVALQRNEHWIGWAGEVLVDEVGKISGTWIGRNFAYKPITITSADDLLGKTICIRVVEAFPTHLKGEIIG